MTRALDMRRPGKGIGGYAAWALVNAQGRPDLSGSREWVGTPGLLEGATGVALAFLAAATSVEPRWDRTFLLSLASPGSR